ncbi:DUF5687 family protein [Salinibacter grassmerensis]|uniref:DUF5687 family protein n=1 Tax=Salinibacter grassmerensis TaxID=3040353 RepID=UPI0021E935E3|nr:DUF5687 family protein [Salinibacter grassmerensis]
MSYFSLLRHQWHAVGPRASSARTALQIGGAVFLLLLVAGAGVWAEAWIRAFRPGANPVRWVSSLGLPLGALYVVGRSYQSPLGLRPYLPLPVRSTRLVRFALTYALLHPINVVLLALGVGFWAQTVMPAHAWGASLAYGGGALLGLGSATHLARLFARALARRPLRVALLVAGGGLVGWAGVATGTVPVLAYSEWLFVGGLEFRPVPIMLLAGTYGGALMLHRRHVRRRLSLDDTRGERKAGTDPAGEEGDPQPTAPEVGMLSRAIDRLLPLGSQRGVDRGFRDANSKIWALLAVEWRLVSRNRQPRRLGILLAFPPLVALIGGLGAATSGTMAYEGSTLFIWGVTVGGWVVDYGGRLFGWEGARLQGILTREVQVRELLRAKVAALVLGTLVLWVIPLPVFALVSPAALGLHAAFLVYILGWGVPVMVVTAPLARTPIDLNSRGVFSGTGLGGRYVSTIALLCLPAVGLFVWADTTFRFALGLAILGGISGLLTPLWMRVLRVAWRRYRHDMLAAFREADR